MGFKHRLNCYVQALKLVDWDGSNILDHDKNRMKVEPFELTVLSGYGTAIRTLKKRNHPSGTAADSTYAQLLRGLHKNKAGLLHAIICSNVLGPLLAVYDCMIYGFCNVTPFWRKPHDDLLGDQCVKPTLPTLTHHMVEMDGTPV